MYRSVVERFHESHKLVELLGSAVPLIVVILHHTVYFVFGPAEEAGGPRQHELRLCEGDALRGALPLDERVTERVELAHLRGQLNLHVACDVDLRNSETLVK